MVASLVAVLLTGSAAFAQAQSVTVPEFSCEAVTVEGSGWEQTEATVEVGVLPPGGEVRDDLVAGPVQVFPDAESNIPATTVTFDRAPADGQYAAVVVVDSIVRGQSAGFTLTGCAKATLPRTGGVTIPLLGAGLAAVAVGLWVIRRTRTA